MRDVLSSGKPPNHLGPSNIKGTPAAWLTSLPPAFNDGEDPGRLRSQCSVSKDIASCIHPDIRGTLRRELPGELTVAMYLAGLIAQGFMLYPNSRFVGTVIAECV